MATATASRRDPGTSTKIPHSEAEELETPRSPFRRRETPRPSISPLSGASPVTERHAAMQDLDADEEGGANNAKTDDADLGDDHDDRSSSLSEPLEDDEDEKQQNGVSSAGNAIAETPAHQSLEVDSEAETERLEETPDKLRRQADGVAKTPSKLSHAATAEDELSEPLSPVPAGPGAASSTSTVETAGQKRKRSDTADSSLTSAESDLEQSPRKRRHSSAEDKAVPAPSADDATEEVEVPAAAEEPEVPADAQDTVTVSPVKPSRGRKGGRPKGKGKKDTNKEPEPERPEETAQPEEEQSQEAVAKSAEELQHKSAASTVFEDLAKQFAAFRDKMYSEKLQTLDAELDMLNQPDCKHPQYLRQAASVDARRAKQVNETQAFYRYKHESLRRTTLGERSQLHSQHFQHVRELREDVMEKLGEDWYNIQKERRQSGQEKDEAYIFKFPTKKSAQIRQQAQYNQEVSVLSGVAKYVGFPAAPDISGVEGETLEGDLKAMKISKRGHQAAAAHSQPVYFPNRTGLVQPQSERIAHEQFIEQNAWARPQGPIVNHGTPNLTHTADWASEPSLHSKHLMHNLSGGLHGANSPFATPVPQRRAPVENASSGTVVNSDTGEPPSSVQAAPPTGDRLQHGFGRDQASPLAVTKQRQNGGELTGFRNISNISGASTIDAPPDSAEREKEAAAREALAGMPKESSTPQHMFDPSQLHRHGFEARRPQDLFANASFRQQDGAFGTPTPLPAPSDSAP